MSGVFVFFQAEDGIRDLVRSRGLGDVYKRQAWAHWENFSYSHKKEYVEWVTDAKQDETRKRRIAVSYTHLTLPTSDLV